MTVQVVVPLVMVNVAPEFEQPPPLENMTGLPEPPPVAPTVNCAPNTAEGGACVVTVIACAALVAFTVSVTSGAAL